MAATSTNIELRLAGLACLQVFVSFYKLSEHLCVYIMKCKVDLIFGQKFSYNTETVQKIFLRAQKIHPVVGPEKH